MQNHPIIIPRLTKANYPAPVAAIRLQAGALGLSPALKDANHAVDPLLVRTLAYLTNVILVSILGKEQSEAIHGNPELKLHPLLILITAKFNRTSPADHEALKLQNNPNTTAPLQYY